MGRLLNYLYGGARFAVADDGVIFDCKEELLAKWQKHVEDNTSRWLYGNETIAKPERFFFRDGEIPDHPPDRPGHRQLRFTTGGWSLPEGDEQQ